MAKVELELEYRGYILRFSENQEVWNCYALNVNGEKISTVKAKIDKIIAASRKLAEPLPMIYIDHHNRISPVRVISLAQPRGKDTTPQQAWCLYPGTERYFDYTKGAYAYRDVEERGKRDLSTLFLDTPENRKAIAEIERLNSEINQAHEKIKEARKGMASAVGHFHVEIEESE
jgi:hypothetical protein